MNYAPSRYQFRSDIEFEQAMTEWLYENEPTYMVNYFNYESHQWESREFFFLFEAVAFWKTRLHEDYIHDSVRKANIDTHYPSSWGVLPTKYLAPGETPEHRRPLSASSELPGGSRDDYKMAGYNRHNL